ncbi:MAG: hypothetical protein OEM84_07700 [Acidimicrobiia bacterium]|nr:hypothetical protein [Acidimicrobiia bacterium]MDH5616786.1 hypothetical protein [Acidimicrobiia bacterium]
MKRMTGIALLIALLSTGCRPMGLPAISDPVESTTTTIATRTTTRSIADSGPSQPLNPAGSVAPSEGTAPEVAIDLTELDALLAELDDVLADVDGAMKEGEEQ